MRPFIEDIANDLASHEGKTITLSGWLYNKRSSGKLHFLQLRDGTATLQCVVFHKDVSPELFEKAGHLAQETALRVTGEVRKDDRSPLGFELGVETFEVVSEPAGEYPITPKEHGVAFLMDHRHLWLRSKRQHAIMRIRAEIVNAIRNFFDGLGFTLVDAPIFTPAACEGTSNLFEVKYFDDSAYLTQSGQLYMEAAAMALGKVYCFGPTFRAEKSKTRRHLTEFWMIEPEIAYATLEDVMDLQEKMVCRVIEQVLERRSRELADLERDTSLLERVKPPFPRMTYAEAIEVIKKNGDGKRETPAPTFGDDFGAEDETILGQSFETPLLVHRYPPPPSRPFT